MLHSICTLVYLLQSNECTLTLQRHSPLVLLQSESKPLSVWQLQGPQVLWPHHPLGHGKSVLQGNIWSVYLQIDETYNAGRIVPISHTHMQFNRNIENCTFSRSNGQSSCWDSHRCNRVMSSASWCTSTRAHRGSMHMRQCSWCQSSL